MTQQPTCHACVPAAGIGSPTRLCPLHAAAPKLLAVLEGVLREWMTGRALYDEEGVEGYKCIHCNEVQMCDWNEPWDSAHKSDCFLVPVCTAIAKVRGESGVTGS